MTAMTTRYAHPDALVDTNWLADHLRDPALRVFDCTTYLRYETGTGRPYRVESGRSDYNKGHIPGSAFLDLQGELSDGSSPLNFTMPALDVSRRPVRRQGHRGGHARRPLRAREHPQWATRVWWMLRAVGFDDAAVLDGGFDKWSAEARPTETTETRYPPATLAAKPRPELFVGKDQVRAAIGDAGACTINALAPDLHRGDNPRYGRPGRVPGSVNVPALALVDADSLTLKPPEAVAESLRIRRRGPVEAHPALLRRRHRGDARRLPAPPARLPRHRRLRRVHERVGEGRGVADRARMSARKQR